MIILESIIPFTKDLEFQTKVSEITSISLERDFTVKECAVTGNLYVTGEYKSHEISANVSPFNYKIPFTIEIPDNIDKESIRLEINDFAYEMLEDTGISVHVELLLSANEEEKVIEEEPAPKEVEVDSDEIIRMLEEETKNEKDEKTNEEPEETPRHDEEIKTQDTNILLNSTSNTDEYITYHIHVLKEGETIASIASLYNIKESTLQEYNDLTNVSTGYKIVIPSTDES